MQKVLLIDNYDSFTHNLVQVIKQCGVTDIDIVKNDDIPLDELEQYSHFFLSPGPGLPHESWQLMDFLNQATEDMKIFGVCLGLQAIGEHFGCRLKNFGTVFHGRKMRIHRTENRSPIFEEINGFFYAGRYHSWGLEVDTLSDEIIVTAEDDSGEIMAIEHISRPVFAVQFHPESYMTPEGKTMIQNFLTL